MTSLDKSFVKSDDLMARNIAGETLIVPIKNHVGDLSAIYTLNEVGARIWQLLDGQHPVTEIAAAVSLEYDVTADEAAQDVLELCDSMEAAGLIHAATAAQAGER